MSAIKDALNIAMAHSVPLTVINNKNVYTENEVTQFSVSQDGILGVDFFHEAHRDPGKGILCPDRRFDVYALKDDKEMARQTIGRLLVPNTCNYILETAPYTHHKIPSLQPAVAALENPIIDRNFSAALNAANGFFLKANEAKLSGSDAGIIHGLRNKVFDPTRLVFRMAQMWWYHVLAEREGKQPMVNGTINNATRIESVARLRACLTDGLADTSVLFIDTTRISGQEALVLSILRRLAASISYRTDGTDFPSIITKDIPVGAVNVYYTGIQEYNTTFDTFTSQQVWDTSMLWCAQYGIVDLLHEQVRAVGSLLHSHSTGVDPLYCAERLHISLPVLLLGPGALTPLSVAADALNPTMISDPPNPVTLTAELVLRNQLIGAGLQEVVWAQGMSVKRTYEDEQHAARRRMHALFDRHRTGYLPAIALATKAVCKLAIEVRIGKFTATMRPAGEYLRQNLQALSTTAFSWEEAYDMFPTVPSMSLAALTQPKRAVTIIQAGLYYKVLEVFNTIDCGTIEALEECGSELHFWERRPREVSFHAHALPVRKNYRGALCDRPLPNFALYDGREIVVTAKAPDDSCAMRLHRHRSGESKWDWFTQRSVGGTDSSWRPDWDTTGTEQKGTILSRYHADSTDEDTQKESEIGVNVTDTDLTRGEKRDLLTSLVSEALKSADQGRETASGSGLVIGRTQKERLKRVKKHLTGGVWGALFNAYENSYNGKDIAQGMTRDHYFNAITPTVSTQLAGISLATALPPIPMKERQTICKDIATMCRRVAALGNNHVATEKLCNFSVKADNLAVVMGRNPAVSTEELKILGYELPEDAADLDDMAPAILEFGGALVDYAAIPGRVLTYVGDPNGLEWDTYLANGYVKSKDQSGVTRGCVRLEKTEHPAAPQKGVMDFYLSMGDDAAAFEERVKALVQELMPPPQKPNTLEEFKKEHFTSGVFEPDLSTEMGQKLQQWYDELLSATKPVLGENTGNWDDSDSDPEVFQERQQGGVMPSVLPSVQQQADVVKEKEVAQDTQQAGSDIQPSGPIGTTAEAVDPTPGSAMQLPTTGNLDMQDS
jgi:hypothetical protein